MADVSFNRINPSYRIDPHKEEPESRKRKKNQEEEEKKDQEKKEDTFIESKEEEKKEKKFMGHTMDWVSLNKALNSEFNETA